MRFHRLRLENIRSYESAEVSFEEGVTLFAGDIGSGKSTILLAIEFALFGLGETDSTHLLRHGAKVGEVALTFDVGGERCTALRSLKRRRKRALVDRCVLTVDGHETELSSAEMKPRVLELLSYRENPDPKAKSDIFRYGVYTPQEEMRTILDTRKSMREQRKQTLRRAFGVEDYRLARDNLALLASELRTRAAELKGRADRVDEGRAEVASARKTLAALETEVGTLALEVEEAGARAEEARLRIEELEAVEGERKAAETRVAELKTQISGARARGEALGDRLSSARDAAKRLEGPREELKCLTDIPQELEAMETRGHELEVMRRAYTSAAEELGRLRGELEQAEDLERELEGVSERLRALEDPGPAIARTEGALREAEAEAVGLRERLSSLERDLLRAEAELEELSTLDGEGTCPRCKQPVSGEHLERLLKEDKAEARRIKGRMRELGSKAVRAEGTAGELRVEHEGLTVLGRERDVLASDREGLSKRLEAKGALLKAIEASDAAKLERELAGAEEAWDGARLGELRDLDARRREMEGRIQELEVEARDVAEIERAHRDAEEELKDLGKKEREASATLASLDERWSPEELAEARRGREGSLKRLSELEARLQGRRERSAEMEAEVEALEARLGELEEQFASWRTHTHLLEWLQRCYGPALEEIERAVMAAIADELDVAASRWFDLLVEDPDLELSVDDDFVPTVQQQGWEVAVDALSGGERTSVAFAYRLALNDLVRRIASQDRSGVIVLDEPTDGFSKEQLGRMGALLRELEAEQVIIVSHERELEVFADRVYLVEKVAGNSSVRARA